MWWSKQAAPAARSFSTGFSSTGVIDSPMEAPSSQPANATSYPSSSPRSDLRLDTVIPGAISLNCKRLTIGETAKATADVVAREVIVYGELAGHLHAAERIEIKKSASVTGDLTTRRILIEEGAYFKGTVQIERRKKIRETPQQRA